nr:GNAT family N-acetyltransferase [Nocardioides thalensis]
MSVVESDGVDERTRAELRELWDSAFDDFGDDDADHAYGGVHVLARDGGRLLAHASAVPRRIRFGDGPWREIGYVEAVAVVPERQGEGLGRQVMRALQVEIAARWPVAMLSTGSHGFYEGLGWERWDGRSFTQTPEGAVADGEEDGLMILRVEPRAVPDLAVEATCEDRPGDAW